MILKITHADKSKVNDMAFNLHACQEFASSKKKCFDGLFLL